jgi:hypothetical protein
VEDADRREQVTDDLQGDVDLDVERDLGERLEDRGQPVPVERVVGDDERLLAGLGAVDAAQPDVAGMAEVDQAADPFAERRFLRRNLRHQLQVLDGVSARVDDPYACAEPVLEGRRGGGAVGRSRQSGHGRFWVPPADPPWACWRVSLGESLRTSHCKPRTTTDVVDVEAEIDTSSRQPHGQKVS